MNKARRAFRKKGCRIGSNEGVIEKSGVDRRDDDVTGHANSKVISLRAGQFGLRVFRVKKSGCGPKCSTN